MSSKRKFDHIHKYQRVPIGHKGHQIFKCLVSSCTHFLPDVNMALGRLCVCWSCLEPFAMNARSITLVRPTCESCREKHAAELEQARLENLRAS